MNAKIDSYQYFLDYNPYRSKAQYIGGMPGVDTQFPVRFMPTAEGVEIKQLDNPKPTVIFLARQDVVSVDVENQSTIESRVSLGRFLAVGLFALAWKKRSKVPLSFLVITYRNDIGDEQQVLFQSEKPQGFQEFTNIRYNLFKFWKVIDEDPSLANSLRLQQLDDETAKERENTRFKIGCFIFIAVLIVGFFLFLAISDN